MDTGSFLRLRFVGMRFSDHAIPLEVLKDVAALEEMIVEVAKRSFLQDNPDRQRSPRGFTKGINLKLTTVDQGNTVLDIKLGLDQPPLLFPPLIQRQLEAARDAIIGAVDAAAQGRPVGRALPGQALSYFDKIGRSLKDEEALEFANPDGRVTATLTRHIRQLLVRESSEVKVFTEELTARGVVPEADQDEMTFEIQLLDGRKVKAPIAPQHLDTIREAYNGYKDGLHVLFQGIGRFNRNDRLLGFDSIEHLSILDALDVETQLDHLRLMQDGWLDGGGLAPPKSGLDWLANAFELHFPDEAPLPHLYPTEMGGVQAEWSIGPTEVTFEVDLETCLGEWHALNLHTNAASERTLNCNDDEDWKWLVTQLDGLRRNDA
ncbi:MAG: hypothetical protein OXP66_10780 [Candidatus Tectomicrobia bacterium]|nr:hypothetical protein [Candidatus Tectomicrobia bacterium]